MKSGHYTIEEWDEESIRKIPSLVDLCVQKAVDNVRYLGDVGETDFHLLERFLPHCTVEQLTHIEDSTEERDLSPVTDKLWKNFYMLQFGVKSTNIVVERMKEKRVSFSWRQLYEAKLKDVEEAQQKSFERIKQLYKKKMLRSKVDKFNYAPRCHPQVTKGVFGEVPFTTPTFLINVGSSSIGNTKSGIMKKAKLEFLNSREVKNLSAMKKTNVQNNHRVSPVIKKPSHFPGKSPSASSSKFCTSTARRF